MNDKMAKALKVLEEGAYEMGEAERKAQPNQAVKAIVSGHKKGKSVSVAGSLAAIKEVWPVQAAKITGFGEAQAPKTGHNCYVCGTFNPDAVANRPNDVYMCYECRT